MTHDPLYRAQELQPEDPGRIETTEKVENTGPDAWAVISALALVAIGIFLGLGVAPLF